MIFLPNGRTKKVWSLATPALVLCLAFKCTAPAFAQSPYEVKDIVLLQPDFVMKDRISVNSLASYIRAVNATATDMISSQRRAPSGGFLVLAIRPGKQSAQWLDFRPSLPPDLAKTLMAQLRAIPVPEVQGGPVVFAVRVSLSGGAPPEQNMPAPAEWMQAARDAGKPLETGELVERIWPH
jgi:hypothetical protein